jgi:hypothetical protein
VIPTFAKMDAGHANAGNWTARDRRRIRMALRPFLRRLSLVTAYLAVAFVGAIVLGVL